MKNMRLCLYIKGTMPQAGIDPLAQSNASYEASSLPPSHNGWIAYKKFMYLDTIAYMIIESSVNYKD